MSGAPNPALGVELRSPGGEPGAPAGAAGAGKRTGPGPRGPGPAS